MSEGWLCPKCGSAHAPEIKTCPISAAPYNPRYISPLIPYIPNTPYIPYNPSIIPYTVPYWYVTFAPTVVDGSGGLLQEGVQVLMN